MEQFMRYAPFSPIVAGVATNDMTVTVFEPQGDRAYLAGFVTYTLKKGPPGTNAVDNRPGFGTL